MSEWVATCTKCNKSCNWIGIEDPTNSFICPYCKGGIKGILNGEKVSKDEAELLMRSFLEEIGLDLSDPNLIETPARITKMFRDELFTSLKEDPPRMTIFPNEGINELIMLDNINFTSVCAHHLCFFSGIAHFAYLPQDSIVGISKIPRLIEYHCKKPQIQELLTQEIINDFDELVKPKGCMLIMRATHSCLVCRGVKTNSDVGMTTSAMKGIFHENPSLKDEVLELLKIRNGK